LQEKEKIEKRGDKEPAFETIYFIQKSKKVILFWKI